jgi:hypothetical protein
MKHLDLNKKAMLFVILLLLVDVLAHDGGPEGLDSPWDVHAIIVD